MGWLTTISLPVLLVLTQFSLSLASQAPPWSDPKKGSLFWKCFLDAMAEKGHLPQQEREDVEYMAETLMSAIKTTSISGKKSAAKSQALSMALASSVAELIVQEAQGSAEAKAKAAAEALEQAYLQTTGHVNRAFIHEMSGLINLFEAEKSNEIEEEISDQQSYPTLQQYGEQLQSYESLQPKYGTSSQLARSTSSAAEVAHSSASAVTTTITSTTSSAAGAAAAASAARAAASAGSAAAGAAAARSEAEASALASAAAFSNTAASHFMRNKHYLQYYDAVYDVEDASALTSDYFQYAALHCGLSYAAAQAVASAAASAVASRGSYAGAHAYAYATANAAARYFYQYGLIDSTNASSFGETFANYVTSRARATAEAKAAAASSASAAATAAAKAKAAASASSAAGATSSSTSTTKTTSSAGAAGAAAASGAAAAASGAEARARAAAEARARAAAEARARAAAEARARAAAEARARAAALSAPSGGYDDFNEVYKSTSPDISPVGSDVLRSSEFSYIKDILSSASVLPSAANERISSVVHSLLSEISSNGFSLPLVLNALKTLVYDISQGGEGLSSSEILNQAYIEMLVCFTQILSSAQVQSASFSSAKAVSGASSN